MFSPFISVAMPLSDRPSAKGFDFSGQGLSAGRIEGTTKMGYCSHMISEVRILETVLLRSRKRRAVLPLADPL